MTKFHKDGSQKTPEERLEELEEFQYKVELGSRWLMCVLYTIGALVATAYYMLGIVHWKP